MTRASVAQMIRDELAGELAGNPIISDVRQGFDPQLGGDYLTVCHDWLDRRSPSLEEQYPDWQKEFCGLPVLWVEKYRPNLAEEPPDQKGCRLAYIDGDGKLGYCYHCAKPARRGLVGFLHNRRESSLSETTQLAYSAEMEARMMEPSIFGRWFWDIEEVYWYVSELLQLPEVKAICDPERLARVYFAVETMDNRYWPTGRLERGREQKEQRFLGLSPRGMNEAAVLHEVAHLVTELLPGMPDCGEALNCVNCNHTGEFLEVELKLLEVGLGLSAAQSMAKAMISNWAINREGVPLDLRPTEAEMQEYVQRVWERSRPRPRQLRERWNSTSNRGRNYRQRITPEIWGLIEHAQGEGVLELFEEAARAFGISNDEALFLLVATALVDKTTRAGRDIQARLGRRICENLVELGEPRLFGWREGITAEELLAMRAEVFGLGIGLSRSGQAQAILADDRDESEELVSLVGHPIAWVMPEWKIVEGEGWVETPETYTWKHTGLGRPAMVHGGVDENERTVSEAALAEWEDDDFEDSLDTDDLWGQLRELSKDPQKQG